MKNFFVSAVFPFFRRKENGNSICRECLWLVVWEIVLGRRRGSDWEEMVDNRVPWSLGLFRSSEGSLKIICIEKPFRKFYAKFS